MRHRTQRLMLALAAVALTAACGDSETGPAPSVPVATVEITPVTGDLWAGTVRQLQATPRAADGTPLIGRSVSWATQRQDIATVDGAGRLTAQASGTTTIIATSEGKSGQISVTVSEVDLLYEGYWTGLPEMFVLSLKGGEPARVLPPHTVLSDPKASPNGSTFAYVIADYESSTGDIYSIRHDGSQVRQLTASPELDDQPAWSPDGTRIAFRSYRTQALGDIWVMHADGSHPVLLTPDPAPGVTDENRPAWSPDGQRIAYASNAGGDYDIWTMRADGSDKRRLTSTPDFDAEPTWSPDGQQIAFRRSTAGAGSDIMVIPASGGTPTRIATPELERSPSWSPDGRLIAFTSQTAIGATPQVYTMRPDGSERTLRTHNAAWNGGRNPGWLRR